MTDRLVLTAGGRPVGCHVTYHRLPARLSPRPYLHPFDRTLVFAGATEDTRRDPWFVRTAEYPGVGSRRRLPSGCRSRQVRPPYAGSSPTAASARTRRPPWSGRR